MVAPVTGAPPRSGGRGRSGGGGRAGGRGPRTVRGSLASIVLATEFLVVILAALVVFGLRVVPGGVALGGGAALLVVIAVAAASANRPLGIALGWLVQAALIATGLLEPTVAIVGLIFLGIWVYCMIVGGRIDRREAATRS